MSSRVLYIYPTSAGERTATAVIFITANSLHRLAGRVFMLNRPASCAIDDQPPFWRSGIDAYNKEMVRNALINGNFIILYESIFELSELGVVDALIVHNHFPAFQFPGRPI